VKGCFGSFETNVVRIKYPRSNLADSGKTPHPPPSPPDLIVSDLSVEKYQSGTDRTLLFRVKNLGGHTGSGATIQYRLTVRYPTGNELRRANTFSLPRLEPNEESGALRVEPPFPWPWTDSTVVNLCINHDRAMTENDYRNNCWINPFGPMVGKSSADVAVGNKGPADSGGLVPEFPSEPPPSEPPCCGLTGALPDLTIAEIGPTLAGECSPGESVVLLTVRVKNLGPGTLTMTLTTGPKSTGPYIFTMDEHGIGWEGAASPILVPKLDPGQSQWITLELPYLESDPSHMTSPQTHPFQVFVDPFGLLDEANEANNTANVTVVIPPGCGSSAG
jgi:hypothetical protein